MNDLNVHGNLWGIKLLLRKLSGGELKELQLCMKVRFV